ncbi:MAG: tRNA (guanosine(37)-N1)-methyltransferase TrmD [Planctomycetes bacterium]|nr:tRNA (guanosine(37)-N1)-methyltransferase TrmD [Planctomycetota bacterium]
MLVQVLTLFPRLINDFVALGLPRIAIEKGALSVQSVDLRGFTHDVHRTVDDRPFGGGAGMVLMCAPIVDAVEALEQDPQTLLQHGVAHRVLLTPRGRRLDQRKLRELAKVERLLLLCGHYEGIDERVRLAMPWDEISIGDFVLSGGEPAALALLDGVARLLPGVTGDPESTVHESFEDDLLEAPHFTRPREFRGMAVPEVLLSGDHAAIGRWRHEQSWLITEERRADLLQARAARHAATEGKPWIE